MAIIEDKPTDALVDDSRYRWERSVLPHVAELLADRDLFLREIFRYALAAVIFSYHGYCPRSWKKKGNCYVVCEGREVQRAEAIVGVDVLEARALSQCL